MPSTPEPHEQWYVLHVLSGQENSVRDRIIRKAKDAELSDFIYRVEVPTELISEVRNGKKTERHSKLFPGYVYANMYLLEADGTLNKDLWYFIQQIDGVISIAGSRNAPLPMRKREVEDLLPLLDAEAVAARPKVEFAVGDPVRVCEGPFQSQEGTIEEIDPEKGKLRVSVSIFGCWNMPGFIPSGVHGTTPACTPVPCFLFPFMKSTAAARPPTTAPASWSDTPLRT